MASVCLFFAWLLYTMRMVASTVYLEPEEPGELTPQIKPLWDMLLFVFFKASKIIGEMTFKLMNLGLE